MKEEQVALGAVVRENLGREGIVLSRESALTWLRPASYEDFLSVVEHTGVDGRLKLVKVFPHYVDLALEKRRQDEA